MRRRPGRNRAVPRRWPVLPARWFRPAWATTYPAPTRGTNPASGMTGAAGEKIERVGEQRPQRGETVLHGAGAARQIHDQGTAYGTGQAARERRERILRSAAGAQMLGDARCL